MICKHCGYIIAPSDRVCKNCGKAVSLSGGNGFWDIAGEPKPLDPPPPQPPRYEPIVNESPKNNNLPFAVCLGLCFVLIIVLAAGRISNKSSISRLTSDYESRLGEQQTLYESRLHEQENNYKSQISQMESRILSLEEEIRQLSDPQMPVIVKSPPSDEAKRVGFKNSAESWLFGFVVEGEALDFQWEKQQEDGEWRALEFDEWNVDKRYGLKREQNLQLGSSKLVAVGLTQESAGKYRCTVTTGHGSASAEVTLTIETDSIDEPPTLSSLPTSVPFETSDRESETSPTSERQSPDNSSPEAGHFFEWHFPGKKHD